jgi:catechol-2,3-dioxygenase
MDLSGQVLKRVVGIGGVFFKAKNPEKLREWYRDHLGFSLEEWGSAVFQANGAWVTDPEGNRVELWEPPGT